jgi:hypothetical protein
MPKSSRNGHSNRTIIIGSIIILSIIVVVVVFIVRRNQNKKDEHFTPAILGGYKTNDVKECPSNTAYNADYNGCILTIAPTNVSLCPTKCCPTGYIYDSKLKTCVWYGLM